MASPTIVASLIIAPFWENATPTVAPQQGTAPGYGSPVPVAENLGTTILGTVYSETISAQGGTAPYTFSLLSGSLPTGLSFAGSTGIISGTTTATGTFTFVIGVTDANGYTGSQTFQIIVAAPAASGGGSYAYAG